MKEKEYFGELKAVISKKSKLDINKFKIMFGDEIGIAEMLITVRRMDGSIHKINVNDFYVNWIDEV